MSENETEPGAGEGGTTDAPDDEQGAPADDTTEVGQPPDDEREDDGA